MEKQIIVFIQDLCPFCEMAKRLLREHSVPHVIRNTSTDWEARREFLRLSAEMLPTFIIAGRMYVGYNPHHLRILIEKEFGINIPKEKAVIPKTQFKRLATKNPELQKNIFPMSLKPRNR